MCKGSLEFRRCQSGHWNGGGFPSESKVQISRYMLWWSEFRKENNGSMLAALMYGVRATEVKI